MAERIIKEGKHSSRSWENLVSHIFPMPREKAARVTCILEKNCWYERTATEDGDEDDWNKLFGISSLWPRFYKKRGSYPVGGNSWYNKALAALTGHVLVKPQHSDSWRIGWRPSPQPYYFELCLYSYHKGVRFVDGFRTLVVADDIMVFNTRFYNHICTTTLNRLTPITHELNQEEVKSLPLDVKNNGWYLGFYKGGNIPAHQQMRLTIYRG